MDQSETSAKNLGKVIMQFFIRADRSEKLAVESEEEEEADRNQKGPYILYSELMKAFSR